MYLFNSFRQLYNLLFEQLCLIIFKTITVAYSSYKNLLVNLNYCCICSPTRVKMSLLENIRRKRNALSHTKTIVTTVEGDIITEDRLEDGTVATKRAAGKSVGYVVDLKPDYHVAQVLPWLCMGSQDSLQNANVLKLFRISCVLSVGVEVSPALSGIECMFVNALDLPEFCLKDILAPCFAYIDAARHADRVVYVHCNAGVSRSASVVIAYLMSHERLTYGKAFDRLRLCRPSVKPNNGFVKQLLAYEKMLALGN